MRGRHLNTLESIFSDPVSGSIKWRDVEGMLVAFGAEIFERRGSRILIVLGDNRAVFHRPHPSPDTDKGAVKAVRRFLLEAGIRP